MTITSSRVCMILSSQGSSNHSVNLLWQPLFRGGLVCQAHLLLAGFFMLLPQESERDLLPRPASAFEDEHSQHFCLSACLAFVVAQRPLGAHTGAWISWQPTFRSVPRESGSQHETRVSFTTCSRPAVSPPPAAKRTPLP